MIAVSQARIAHLTHSLDGGWKGLNEFEGKHPPVARTGVLGLSSWSA
jgi:hypothetical protein